MVDFDDEGKMKDIAFMVNEVLRIGFGEADFILMIIKKDLEVDNTAVVSSLERGDTLNAVRRLISHIDKGLH